MPLYTCYFNISILNKTQENRQLCSELHIIIIIIVIIITIIIIIIIISFMQDIYTYILETNYVPREYSYSVVTIHSAYIFSFSVESIVFLH